ncbi:MAG: hypothetical protein Q9203_006654, partial [Teloschistes exilis]
MTALEICLTTTSFNNSITNPSTHNTCDTFLTNRLERSRISGNGIKCPLYRLPSGTATSTAAHRIAQSLPYYRLFHSSTTISAAQPAAYMPSANKATPPPQSTKPPSSSPPGALETEQIRSKGSNAMPASVQIAAEVHKRAPSITEPYVAYAVCEKLIKTCASQADYSIPQRYEKNGVIPKTASGEDLGVGKGWWYEELGLIPTFTTWSQITFLHMYILHVRLRAFHPASAQTWHQHLLDHFFYTAEDRMVRDHNIAARGARNSYLKDLFVQWRGLLAG